MRLKKADQKGVYILPNVRFSKADNPESSISEVGSLCLVSALSLRRTVPPFTVYFNHCRSEWQVEIHSVEADYELRMVKLGHLVKCAAGELFRDRLAFSLLVAHLGAIDTIPILGPFDLSRAKATLAGLAPPLFNRGIPTGIVSSAHSPSGDYRKANLLACLWGPFPPLVPRLGAFVRTITAWATLGMKVSFKRLPAGSANNSPVSGSAPTSLRAINSPIYRGPQSVRANLNSFVAPFTLCFQRPPRYEYYNA